MTAEPDRLSPNQDTFYHDLMEAHAGLSEADSHALNARLVLLLANEIGDVARLKRILALGRAYSDG
ncbi:MAG: DUF2783 domain-containing protein [Rhodobacteraceae bacterium]|nr:DUF2783 domain-containing protein [Paracoccaceae bacterium]